MISVVTVATVQNYCYYRLFAISDHTKSICTALSRKRVVKTTQIAYWPRFKCVIYDCTLKLLVLAVTLLIPVKYSFAKISASTWFLVRVNSYIKSQFKISDILQRAFQVIILKISTLNTYFLLKSVLYCWFILRFALYWATAQFLNQWSLNSLMHISINKTHFAEGRLDVYAEKTAETGL